MLLLNQGGYGKALPYYERALAMVQALYPKDKYPQGHPHLAGSLNNVGLLLQDQGEYGKALPYLEQALAMYQALYPREKYPQGHPNLALSLNNLGTLLQDQGEYGKALPYLERALAMKEALCPPDKYPQGHPALAGSLNNLGRLLQDQGEYAKALPYLERALAMKEALYPPDKYPQGHRALATSLTSLGSLLHAQGEYGKALPSLERALAMFQALYPADKYPQGHSALATGLHNLGSLLQDQGEYGKALPSLERALAMLQVLYPKEKYPQGHPTLATSLMSLGMLFRAQGEYGKALPYCERALAMRQALYPKDQYPQGHLDLATSLSNLGFVLLAQREYGKALPYCERAQAMLEGLYPKDQYPQGHPALAGSLHNLGVLLWAQGEYGKALPYCERTLAMYRGLYPKDQYPQGHFDLATSLSNLGFVLLAQGEYGKALPYYERALAMHQGLGKAFLATASEAEARNFLLKIPLTRDGYLSVARRLPDTADPSYAHVWQEKSALARLLARRQRTLLLADPGIRELNQRLTDTRQTLAVLLLALPGRFKDQAQRVQELTDRKEKLEREIAQKLPAFAELQAIDRLSPADLLAKLPTRSAFVDLLRYFRFEQDPKVPGQKGEQWTLSYVAFVLRPGQPIQRVELGEAAPIEKALAEWRQAVAAWKPGRPDDSRAAVTLRQRLGEPLTKSIPADTEIVFLAPDGPLTGLQWAALPGKKPGTVLLEDHALAIVPHGRFLVEHLMTNEKRHSKDGTILAFGGVQYDQEPVAVKPPAGLLALDRGPEAGDQKLRWPFLKGTELELEQVRALAGQREVRVRRGPEASASQLLADLPQARYAHLATHGFFADPKFRSVLKLDETLYERLRLPSGDAFDRAAAGARNPLVLSGLVLAGANLDLPDRGILTAEAIAGLPLQKLELVVLSACETGLGEVAGGEGVFGLQRAFHVAGARNVIATLWKVDDDATAALMDLFYHKLWRENKPPIQALREAQLTLYRNPSRIPKLAKLRGPDLTREVTRPPDPAEVKAGERAPVKLWAGFILSGLGR
jgi:tetratricopeptide (TPR) repeat protein